MSAISLPRDNASRFLFVVLLIASRLVFFELTQYTSDDAFTTYRYARNIAAGEGFVYNPGEKVQGTSSPLYTMYLAGMSIVLGSTHLPLVSRLTGLIADSVTLWLLLALLGSSSSHGHSLAAIAFILFPKINLIGISGMEAPLVTLLMLVSYIFLQRNRPFAFLLTCALLLLTRADTALWVLLLTVSAIIQHRFRLRSALLPGALYGGWMLFSWRYFGSWLPNSVPAKLVSWQHLFPPFDPLRVMTGYLSLHASETVASIVVLIFVLPIVIEGYFLFRERSPLLVFPLFFLAYNLIYAFARILIPDWYYYPGYVAYLIPLGTLVARVVSPLSQTLKRYCAPSMIAFAVICLVAANVVAVPRWARSLGQGAATESGLLGTWLKEHAVPGAQVLLEPIGRVGWISGLYVEDYIGLVSPDVVEYRRASGERDSWYGAWLRDRTPEFIVQRSWEFERNALFEGYGGMMFQNQDDRNWFLTNYRKIDWSPPDTGIARDSIYLVLFERSTRRPAMSPVP